MMRYLYKIYIDSNDIQHFLLNLGHSMDDLSIKKIRTHLENSFELDLSDRKSFIKQEVDAILEELNSA